MKKPVCVPFWLLVVALGLFGCEKAALQDEYAPQLSALRTSAVCGAFGYADSTFYLREQATDYLEYPLTAQAGRYGASPAGLQINATTGAINVSKSETGLRYRVYFIPTGTTDTCSRYITISGINYRNHVYQLARHDSLALPYYNATRALPPPCSEDDDDDDDDDEDDEEDEDDDDDDDDDACEFDDGSDDDDGDGTADEPAPGQQLRPLGIDINTRSGVINLRQTLRNGTFGTVPVSGTSKNVRLFYRLNDASNKALNHIDLKISYYERLSDVPQSVIDEINGKNAATLRRGRTAAEEAKPRPPHILIVGRIAETEQL
jgi:hypothetical protein